MYSRLKPFRQTTLNRANGKPFYNDAQFEMRFILTATRTFVAKCVGRRRRVAPLLLLT